MEQPPAVATETVRDRLWLWSHEAGAYNGGIWKVPGESHCSAAEAARELGLANVIFIQWQGRPQPPFIAHAQPLGELKRLMWSAVDNRGQRASPGECEHFFELARVMPNVCGAFLDDFLIDVAPGDPTPDVPESRAPDELPAALSVREIEQLHRRFREFHLRPLNLGVVLYAHQVRPEIIPHLRHCDTISLWTSKAEDLEFLEANLAALERLASGQRIFLGCYMYDFGNERTMPLDQMELQCRLGLQWIEQGRIEGMIFLGANLCGRNLEAVEFTRRWIAEVGDRPLPTGLSGGVVD